MKRHSSELSQEGEVAVSTILGINMPTNGYESSRSYRPSSRRKTTTTTTTVMACDGSPTKRQRRNRLTNPRAPDTLRSDSADSNRVPSMTHESRSDDADSPIMRSTDSYPLHQELQDEDEEDERRITYRTQHSESPQHAPFVHGTGRASPRLEMHRKLDLQARLQDYGMAVQRLQSDISMAHHQAELHDRLRRHCRDDELNHSNEQRRWPDCALAVVASSPAIYPLPPPDASTPLPTPWSTHDQVRLWL